MPEESSPGLTGVVPSRQQQFMVWNHADTDTELHKDLKKSILAFAADCGFSISRAKTVWTATYEAVVNAIRYGSRQGDSIKVTLTYYPDDHIEVKISQPIGWRDGKNILAKAKGGQLSLGGTVIMQRLCESVELSNRGKNVSLRFPLNAKERASIGGGNGR